MGVNVWIDIENIPQAAFFRPVIQWLENKGVNVEITIRKKKDILEFLELHGIKKVTAYGTPPGKSKIKKITGLFKRSKDLYAFSRKARFSLALSHTARGVVIPAYLSSIPLIVFYDYEYIFEWLFRKFATLIGLPEYVSEEYIQKLKRKRVNFFLYPGIKEGIYLHDFKPPSSPVLEGEVVVLIRPPATYAHYHTPETEFLFYKILERL